MDVIWRLDPSIKGGPVHDGDSFHVVGEFSTTVPLDVPGYENWGPWRLNGNVNEMTRLAHCNAAERGTLPGEAAFGAVQQWFSNHFPGDAYIPLVPLGRDKYKRLLCDVVLSDGSKLSDFVLTLPGSVPMKLAQQVAP